MRAEEKGRREVLGLDFMGEHLLRMRKGSGAQRLRCFPCMLGGGGLPSLAAPPSGEGWKGSERVGEEKESERGRLMGRTRGQ